MAGQLFGDDRSKPYELVVNDLYRPCYAGDVWRDPPIYFPFEIFDDLGPALFPPAIGRSDFSAIL